MKGENPQLPSNDIQCQMNDAHYDKYFWFASLSLVNIYKVELDGRGSAKWSDHYPH